MDDDGVRSIGVEPRTSTLGIYEGDQGLVPAKAAGPCMTSTAGLQLARLCGCQNTSPKPWSSAQRRQRCRWSHGQNALVQLNLSVHYHFGLQLASSLNVCMACRMGTLLREALVLHMRREDTAMWRSAAAMLDSPPGVLEYGAHMEAWTRG